MTLILKEILWRIKKEPYFHKIFVHIVPKPLIFKLGNADLVRIIRIMWFSYE